MTGATVQYSTVVSSVGGVVFDGTNGIKVRLIALLELHLVMCSATYFVHFDIAKMSPEG